MIKDVTQIISVIEVNLLKQALKEVVSHCELYKLGRPQRLLNSLMLRKTTISYQRRELLIILCANRF